MYINLSSIVLSLKIPEYWICPTNCQANKKNTKKIASVLSHMD